MWPMTTDRVTNPATRYDALSFPGLSSLEYANICTGPSGTFDCLWGESRHSYAYHMFMTYSSARAPYQMSLMLSMEKEMLPSVYCES
jgi:hypothetical protein